MRCSGDRRFLTEKSKATPFAWQFALSERVGLNADHSRRKR
jgi:hypothetical protein